VIAARACLTLLLALWVSATSAQSLQGVTLGAPLPADLPPPQSQQDLGRFQLLHYAISPELALTLWTRANDEAAVLSIQLARTAPYQRAATPLPDIAFGLTTTTEIEARFGPAGPVYDIIGATSRHGRITTHTLSYEIDTGDSVLTFITLEARDQPDSRGRENARLDAIILARRWFQEEVWGEVSYPNLGYAPIASPF